MSPASRQREIGRRIRNVRRDQRWTQPQLADAVGLSRHAVLDIEAGRRPVKLDEAVEFALALEVPLEYLAGITNGYKKVGG